MTMLYHCKRCGALSYPEGFHCKTCGYSRWDSYESALRDNLVHLGWRVWLLDKAGGTLQWFSRKAARGWHKKQEPVVHEAIPGPTLEDWNCADSTGCPHQRYSDKLDCWLVLDKWPPCERKSCGRCQCHNFGRPFRNSRGNTRVVHARKDLSHRSRTSSPATTTRPFKTYPRKEHTPP